MDEWRSGIALDMDTPPVKTMTSKSYSCEQTKRRGVSKGEEALFGSPVTTRVLI